MRKPAITALLFFGALIGILLFLRTNRLSHEPAAEQAGASSGQIEPYAPPFRYPAPSSGTLPELTLPSDSLSRNTGQAVQQALPSLLAGRTGSYSTVELLEGSGTQEFTVSTGWLTPLFHAGGDLPVLRMHIVKDPETESYEITGGELALPGIGLEAGAEAEFGSEEYKAWLHWKKSF